MAANTIKHARLLNLALAIAAFSFPAHADDPLGISDRLEPFVDNYLVESTDNVTHLLHHPVPREIALT